MHSKTIDNIPYGQQEIYLRRDYVIASKSHLNFFPKKCKTDTTSCVTETEATGVLYLPSIPYSFVLLQAIDGIHNDLNSSVTGDRSSPSPANTLTV